MNRYERMEVRGTLPQVGYWELGEKEMFDQFKFQRSEMGKYVNIVVVYNPELGFIDIYFFSKEKIPDKVNGISLSVSNAYQFEDGVIFWSKRNKKYSHGDARNVFLALYRNSAPKSE